MINTAPRTQVATAYVTDHGRDGVPRVFVNVYREGTRLAATEIPGSQWTDVRNALAFASAWLGNQGYTLVSEYVTHPSHTGESLIGCDYRVSLES